MVVLDLWRVPTRSRRIEADGVPAPVLRGESKPVAASGLEATARASAEPALLLEHMVITVTCKERQIDRNKWPEAQIAAEGR
jgi:hypothetical protein